MDVAISGERNVIKTEAGKNLKHKNITMEIQRKCKKKIIPTIMEDTGTSSKSFRQYLSDTPERHKIKRQQKTAILDTAHILSNELM
jgi:hypothetical protein